MNIEIDCRHISDRQNLHETLMVKFKFPAYYGRNLDALYDLLSEYNVSVEIVIRYSSVLKETLGSYADAFFETILQVSQENSKVSVKINDN